MAREERYRRALRQVRDRDHPYYAAQHLMEPVTPPWHRKVAEWLRRWVS